ncbi:MAG: hypothetical protein J5564_05670 [Clostridia bacterium]|nr:hypothetical protein [Clostridia bacterium]
MSEKKQHKVVSANTGAQMSKEEAAAANAAAKKAAAPTGNSTPYRIGAILLWLAAIGFEVLAILVTFGKIDLKFIPSLWQMIGFLVLDLICLVIGSQLWKKANHINPASEKNKVKFWLWNNMGLIMTIICFVPFIVLLLTNKNADKKMKVVGVAVAAGMVIIGGLLGYDWNPVSSEQKEAAMQNITGMVYWTNSLGGKVYHTSEECQALNRTEELVFGTVDQAIAANRTRLCSFCARRDAITGVITDEGTVLDATDVEGAVEEVTEQVTDAAQEPAA